MALQCTDGDPASLRRYCLPVLHEIRAYDGTHNSELFKTLRQYVLTGKSMTRTAEQLMIHKSTVAYRLQRIRSLFPARMETPEELFRLRYSFLLYDLMEPGQCGGRETV